MGKKIEFGNDADYYYNRGMDFADDGKNIEAISNFYLALDLDPGNIYIMSELAYSYYEMGLLNQAIKFYLRILDADRYSDISYIGLIQCFAQKGKMDVALHYLNMGLKYGALDSDYMPKTDPEELAKTPPQLGVIDNNDYSGLIALSGNVSDGSPDSPEENRLARMLLEHVPESSPQYAEARNRLALMLLKSGNNEESVAEAKKIIEKFPDNANAYCTLVSAYFIMGEYEKSKEAFALLDALDARDRNDVAKIAACAADTDNDEMAVKYFGRLFDFVPYEAQPTVMYAVALFNVGKVEEARSYLTALRRIYPDNGMVKYYAMCVSDPSVKERIKIDYDIPQQEYRRRIKYIDERFSALGKVDDVVNGMFEDEELYEDVMWLMSSSDQVYAGHIASFLCQNEYWQPVILDRLIDPEVSPAAKRDNLCSYLKFSKIKKFALVMTDALVFYSPRIPKGGSPVLEDAYWAAFATAAMLSTTFQPKLNKAYKKMIEKVVDPSRPEPQYSAQVLAAILIRFCDVSRLFCNKDECCELFTVSVEDYDECLDGIGLREDEELAVKRYEAKLNKEMESAEELFKAIGKSLQGD
mgnify:FL=1